MNPMRKLVLRNLKLNKKRTTVTIVGIILSVALLSALSSLVMSFRRSLIEFEKAKSGNFHVAFSDVSSKQKDTLEHNILLERVFYTQEIGYGELAGSKNDDKPYVYVLGTDIAGLNNLGFNLIEGRIPRNSSEIVISRHIKTNGRVELKVGDTVTFEIGRRELHDEPGLANTQGTSFLGKGNESIVDKTEKTYTVVGIMERPSTIIEPYTAPGYTVVTYTEAENATDGLITAFCRFNAKGIRDCYKNTANIMDVDAKAFDAFFGSNYGSGYWQLSDFTELFTQIEKSEYKNFTMNNYLIQYERIWPMDGTFRVVFVIGTFVAIIIIVTSVYCIKNSFEISVSEKIRQYGMLAGIGATKKQIRKSVFTEAVVMGAIGLPLGVLSGLFASFILVKLSNVMMFETLSVQLVYYISPMAVTAAVLFGIVTVYLSAISGAVKAARISPIEAIRNQNEIKLKKKKLKAPFYVSKLFGIGGVISYKNIRRNRSKYRTTVVSIALCTVTFIVISYFMSMGFSLVGVSIADDECNISAMINDRPDEDMTVKDFAGLETVERFSIITTAGVNISLDYFNEDFAKKWLNGYSDTDYLLNAFVLDDASFDAYVKECGIKNYDSKSREAKIILINNAMMPQVGDIPAFKLETGDKMTISFCTPVKDGEGNREDTVEDAETAMTRSVADGEITLEIAGTTKVRPFGKQSYSNMAIVMSRSVGEMSGLIGNRGTTLLCFKSSNADKLQDIVETILQEKQDVYGTYYISNRDANARQIRSVLTLLAVFAYGLIAVIALIGVTNIVNTLNTSMELRSRDFATLRSIGMTSDQFEKMVLLESVFTTFKALFWGILLGMLASFGIWKYETGADLIIPFNPPIKAAIGSAVTVLVLVYLIIRISLARINKRNIIETIKNENL